MYIFPQDMNLVWFGLFEHQHLERLKKWRTENPNYQLHLWYASTTLINKTIGYNKEVLDYCATNGIMMHNITAPEGADAALTNIDLVKEELQHQRYIAASDILRTSIMLHHTGFYRDFDCDTKKLPIEPLTAATPFVFAFTEATRSPAPHMLGAATPNLAWFDCLSKIHRISYDALHQYEQSRLTHDSWRTMGISNAMHYRATLALTGVTFSYLFDALPLKDQTFIERETAPIRDFFLDSGPRAQHYIESGGGYMALEYPKANPQLAAVNDFIHYSDKCHPQLCVQQQRGAQRLVAEIGVETLLRPAPAMPTFMRLTI